MASRKKSRKPDRSPSRPLSVWDNLPVKYQHLICLGFLLILPLFQYGDVILGGERFFSPDIVQWRASAESIIDHREEFGEEALWSENMFSGMPAFIVSYKRAVPHVDEIFTWLAPIFPAAALWVMLIGVYLFLLRLKLHPLAATIGALLIAFTTYMPIIVGAGHNAKVYALAFIPWMFYGYLMLTRSTKPLLGLGIFALAAALELRAGHPQVTYFFMYVFAFWWLYDTWQAHKEQQLPSWLKRTGFVVAAGLLALAANIQPYWSIYEYSPYSIRGGSAVEATQSGLDLDYAMAWSHGWFEMTTLAVPGIQGGSSGDNLYWGPKTMTSGPHYLGAIAILLILIALFNVKSGLKWVFLSGAILSMLFALGENFLAFNKLFFDFMPLFDKFRAPEKWLMVTTFSFNVLAAMGANWLFTSEKENAPSSLRKIDWPAGIAIGLGVLLLVLAASSLSYDKPGESRQLAQQVAQQNQVSADDPRVMEVVNNFLAEIREERSSLAQSDILRYLFFVGIGIILIGAFILAKIPAFAAAIIIILLLSVDLISVGNRYIPDSSKIDSSINQTDFMERQRSGYHNFIQQEMSGFDYPYRVFPIDQNPFNNAIPSYFYPSVGGYTGAKMSRYQAAIDNAFFGGPGGLNFGLLDMLNVRYMTVAQDYGLPGYDVVYQQGDGIVLENGNVLPKVFFPDRVSSTTNPAEALEFISAGRFDPASESVLEKTELLEHGRDLSAGAKVITYNAREISFEVTKSEAGYVAISEMYYPKGWTATVNGEETDIFAMNFLLRGIHLPAGEHEITLEFAPASHTIGSALSWFFNLIILGLIGFGFYQSRTQLKPESDTESV